MLNGDEMFLCHMTRRRNGKCAMKRELLKKAKLINGLKKQLDSMFDSSYDALNRADKELDKSYIRGYQDAVNTVSWLIYIGEHNDEN